MASDRDEIVRLGFRLEDALLRGLVARVNTRLQPLPRQLRLSPNYEIYRLVLALHEACNGAGPLPKWELPPPYHDGVHSAHVVVCELCTVVDLGTQPSSRCRVCAKRHEIRGAVLAPVTGQNLQWLVTGYRQKHLHTWCKLW